VNKQLARPAIPRKKTPVVERSKADYRFDKAFTALTAIPAVKRSGVIAKPKKKKPGLMRRLFGKNLTTYFIDEEVKKALK